MYKAEAIVLGNFPPLRYNSQSTCASSEAINFKQILKYENRSRHDVV
jgi:hypothetical protein